MSLRVVLGIAQLATAYAAFYAAFGALGEAGVRLTRPLFWLAWLACFVLGLCVARLLLRAPALRR